MKSKTRHHRLRAFSLVELLIVIAVIGVIASIAIPAMSGLYGKSDAAKIKRNAQEIASTFASAKAAGNSSSFANKAEAIASVTEAPGLTGKGVFATSNFSSPMSGGDAEAAEMYLRYDAAAGVLEYIPDGVTSQYSTMDQWYAAMNSAMNGFMQQNPGAPPGVISSFQQSWVAANPPPSNEPPPQPL